MLPLRPPDTDAGASRRYGAATLPTAPVTGLYVYVRSNTVEAAITKLRPSPTLMKSFVR